MNETQVLTFVLILIGYVASFLFGYYYSKYRGLAANSRVCDNLAGNLEDSTERVEDLEDKLGGLVEAGRDVEAILRKYNTTTAEGKDVEQDSAYSGVDIDSD